MRSRAILLAFAGVMISTLLAGCNRGKPANQAAAQQDLPPNAVTSAPTPTEPAAPTTPTPAKTDSPTSPPAPAHAGNPPLREVNAATAPIVPAAEPMRVVYLEPLPVEGPNDPVTGLLRRELYRQAVLLAAHDELGLTTRDGTLGEMPPGDLPANQRLVVTAEFAVGRPHRVRVEAGAGREVWKAEGAGPAIVEETPAAAVVAAEALSRGGYQTALNRAGLKGQANKSDATGAVPAEVEGWLGQMNFPAQFYALRALHTAAHKTGESPGLLGALVRAYAHAGMLTDAQWGAMPWVFKARALLYAQRMVARDPSSAWGYWHRAYAAALTGLHAAALEDLKLAAAAQGGSGDIPPWVGLAEALCRFNSAGLKVSFADAKLGETARVFHFLTVESAGSRSLSSQAGAAVVVKHPDCDRVHDALIALGVGERGASPSIAYRTFGERFARHVREAPGVPKAVSDVVAAKSPEPELVHALVAAGDPTADPVDPSWALLGRFAQEARIVQVAGRLQFLKDGLNAPADNFFRTAAPLVVGHPIYPFLESYAIDPERWPDEYLARLRSTWVPALSYRHGPLLRAQRRFGKEQSARAAHVAQVHGDWLYYDSALALRDAPEGLDRTQFARRMYWVSPHAPAARAALIRDDASVPADLLATWEAEAQHPEIFEALATRAMRAANWDEARRLFRRATELTPDLFLYRLYADEYKKRGETDNYVATLEAFLKTDDSGLDHARVRVELANHFLGVKNYRRAQTYAETAAESGASFALQCAARCAESLDEWPKAEAHVRRLSEQFPDMVAAWFYWCHRTGRGDAAAAGKLVEERLGQVRDAPSQSELITAAVYRALTGHPELGPELLLAAHRKKREDGALLLAASLSDTLRDVGLRERYLSDIAYESSLYRAARLILNRARDEGEEFVPEGSKMEQAVKATPAPGRGLVCYVLGSYALRRGKMTLAKEYLTKAATEFEPKDVPSAALAATALRSMAKK